MLTNLCAFVEDQREETLDFTKKDSLRLVADLEAVEKKNVDKRKEGNENVEEEEEGENRGNNGRRCRRGSKGRGGRRRSKRRTSSSRAQKIEEGSFEERKGKAKVVYPKNSKKKKHLPRKKRKLMEHLP